MEKHQSLVTYNVFAQSKIYKKFRRIKFIKQQIHWEILSKQRSVKNTGKIWEVPSSYRFFLSILLLL